VWIAACRVWRCVDCEGVSSVECRVRRVECRKWTSLKYCAGHQKLKSFYESCSCHTLMKYVGMSHAFQASKRGDFCSNRQRYGHMARIADGARGNGCTRKNRFERTHLHPQTPKDKREPFATFEKNEVFFDPPAINLIIGILQPAPIVTGDRQWIHECWFHFVAPAQLKHLSTSVYAPTCMVACHVGRSHCSPVYIWISAPSVLAPICYFGKLSSKTPMVQGHFLNQIPSSVW